MKNFVKALNNYEPASKYLRRKFSHLSDLKIKDGIFVGCRVLTPKFEWCKDQNFDSILHSIEKEAWELFRAVGYGILDNMRCENYNKLMKNVLQKYWLQYVSKKSLFSLLFRFFSS